MYMFLLRHECIKNVIGLPSGAASLSTQETATQHHPQSMLRRRNTNTDQHGATYYPPSYSDQPNATNTSAVPQTNPTLMGTHSFRTRSTPAV